MAEKSQPDSAAPGVSPLQVCALCAAGGAVGEDGTQYAPSPQQTAFFTLVWAAKQGARVDLPHAWLADEDGVLLTAAEIREQIGHIRRNLGAFGGAVAQLRRRNAEVWELLRIQMEKPLRGYDCRLADKQDALSDAMLKLWELLLRLPSPAALEASPDALAAIRTLPVPATRIYDFSTPIYAYAVRMVRNALLSILRKKSAPLDADPTEAAGAEGEAGERPEGGYTPDWEALAELLAGEAGQQAGEAGEDVNEAQYVQSLLAWRARLLRLLHAIDGFPQQQRRVLHCTLAARPQFFRAVEVLDAPLPPEVVTLAAPPAPAEGEAGNQTELHAIAAACLAALTDDEAIARQMGSNKNLVAVTRHNAVRRMAGEDLELHDLLARLIEPQRARPDKPAPAPLNLSASQA